MIEQVPCVDYGRNGTPQSLKECLVDAPITTL
jgi:hypothetical protein